MGDIEGKIKDKIKDKKIMIKSFTGGEQGHKLLGCYFMPKPDNTYNFHDRDNQVKQRDITVPSTFKVELSDAPETEWTLSVTSGDTETVGGNWSDLKAAGLADGTYQAEAGGVGEEEETSAASAGACS